MDTVAVDLGSAIVDLAKWTGKELQVEKLPAADPLISLSDWLGLLKPSPQFSFQFRATQPQFTSDTAEAILTLARKHGAGSCVWRGRESQPPSSFGAQWYGNRHRLKPLLVVEWGPSEITYGLELADGTIDELCSTDVNELIGWMQAIQVEFKHVELACCGGLGPIHAAKIAERAGFSRVLIPDYAGCMGVIGMVLRPDVFQAFTTCEPRSIDADHLRDQFSEMMDELGNKITAAGYDFDDVICERFVIMAHAGASDSFYRKCGSVINRDELVAAFLRDKPTPNAGPAPMQAIEMRGALVRAVIDTQQWELPPAVLAKTVATQPLDESTIRSLAGNAEIIDGKTLVAGQKIFGPQIIREPFHLTVVPEGWYAEPSRAGGVMLNMSR